MALLCSGEGITVARSGKEVCTVKLIFIDRSIAAAVRLHYEPRAQIRARRCPRSAAKQACSWGVQLAGRMAIASDPALVFEHKPSHCCFHFIDEVVSARSI